MNANVWNVAERDLMTALGHDTYDPEPAETPRRVVAAFEELLTRAPFQMTTFANDEGYDELVIARDIPVRALCAHHLLPFTGVAHVAYLPKGVGVVIEAERLCMTLRGIQARGARTVTSSLHGLVRDDVRTRAEFLTLARRS